MLQSMGSQVVRHDLATEQQPGMRRYVEYKYMCLGFTDKNKLSQLRETPYHVGHCQYILKGNISTKSLFSLYENKIQGY